MSGPEPPLPADEPPADRRKEFARESGRAARDPDAKRAFLQGRIDVIRTHPTLSETEKEAAVAELLRRLQDLTENTHPPDGRE